MCAPKFKWEEFTIILILLLLFIAVSIGGCATLPKPPSADVCGLYVQPDYPIGGVCAPTEAKSTEEIKYGNLVKSILVSEETYFKPIEEMHGYICFSPSDWQIITEYIAQLKKTIIKNCRK